MHQPELQGQQHVDFDLFRNLSMPRWIRQNDDNIFAEYQTLKFLAKEKLI